MTEPTGWLDMSRFPDLDPETVLTGDQHGLLTTALAVDDADLPDAVWEHMLATVVGPVDDTDPTADGADTDDPAGGGADDDVSWSADLEHTFGVDTVDGADAADPVDHHHGADDAHPGAEDGAL